MIHTRLLPKTMHAFANGRHIVGNISYFVKEIFFLCFHSLHNKDNYLRRESVKTRELLRSKQYVYSSQKTIGSIFAITCKMNPVKIDIYGKMEWEKMAIHIQLHVFTFQRSVALPFPRKSHEKLYTFRTRISVKGWTGIEHRCRGSFFKK